MTKSLSEQLCKLCGVEARAVNYDYSISAEENYINQNKVYPDFTEPSNLIKLMDLKYTPCQSLILLITLHNVGIRSTIDFLEQLIDFLRADGVFIGNIKQAIRDTEWKY